MKAERYLYARIHLVLSARVTIATVGGFEANWGSQLPLVKVVMTIRKPEVHPRSKDRHRQTKGGRKGDRQQDRGVGKGKGRQGGGRRREMDRGREKQDRRKGRKEELQIKIFLKNWETKRERQKQKKGDRQRTDRRARRCLGGGGLHNRSQNSASLLLDTSLIDRQSSTPP